MTANTYPVHGLPSPDPEEQCSTAELAAYGRKPVEPITIAFEGPIVDVTGVEAFYRALNAADLAWHPDTPFEDYVQFGGGLEPCFSAEEADRLNGLMDAARRLDPTDGIALKVYEEGLDRC